MNSNQLTVYLILTLTGFLIYYMLFSIVQYQKGMVFAIGLPMALIVLVFAVLWGDFWPWKRGTQVFTLSGLVGTQVGPAVDEHSGEETRYVAFERKAAKAVLGNKIHEFEGIMSGIRDLVTGTATIPLTAKKSLWEEIPDVDSENRNGCVLFRGKVGGGNLRNPNMIDGVNQIERQSQLIGYARTALTQAEDQIMNLANMKNADLEYTSERLKFIADNVKRNNIILGKSSGAAEAAGELS